MSLKSFSNLHVLLQKRISCTEGMRSKDLGISITAVSFIKIIRDSNQSLEIRINLPDIYGSDPYLLTWYTCEVILGGPCVEGPDEEVQARWRFLSCLCCHGRLGGRRHYALLVLLNKFIRIKNHKY